MNLLSVEVVAAECLLAGWLNCWRRPTNIGSVELLKTVIWCLLFQ